MKKNNGFTLIELLGVVILLSLTTLIIVPIVKETLEDSKQELYEEQINQLEDGLENWSHANIFLLPEGNNTITLSLGQLAQSGYTNQKIKNPKNNKCFSNASTLTITKHNNSYIYEVEELLDVDCELVTEAPTIKLNGNVVEYLNIGDTYTESGVTAKDSDGTDISSFITTTVSGSGTSIDLTSAGTYNITYSVTNDKKVMTAIRTIIIK